MILFMVTSGYADCTRIKMAADPGRAKLWENGAAGPRFGSCHEKPIPGRIGAPRKGIVDILLRSAPHTLA